MKKKKKIKGKKLYWKSADSGWGCMGETTTNTISGTYSVAEPVLTIQIIGNTITIDYKP